MDTTVQSTMTYYDGTHLWSVCRSCGKIRAIKMYPHRSGYLVPLCRACAETAAEALLRGRNIIKLPKRTVMTYPYPYSEENNEELG
ncbi:hypothetical protein LCGC14_1838740 [marine sediment metagenome]|uniref:Uncharacterized protein n=1 Tax=marine sediment metagenome TaxID=412755 RepID=A0A0F9GE00_9ZZZZ